MCSVADARNAHGRERECLLPWAVVAFAHVSSTSGIEAGGAGCKDPSRNDVCCLAHLQACQMQLLQESCDQKGIVNSKLLANSMQ